MNNKTRTINCSICKKEVQVTPRQSHYVKKCWECYTGLIMIPSGVCVITDSDSE